ncbi:MAG: hypothetical protein M3387_12830, partial [Actinomycetota bacterium]|nr:hypothetical protein [Actinomycetota bacterium]
MAAVAVWLLLSDGGGAAGQPQSAGVAPSVPSTESPASETPSETASEPQSTATDATRETRAERLARLRKTDAFVEFASWDRARTAPNYERALGDFAWYDQERGSRIEFLNARQLWDQVSKPVRNDLLLQGPEHRGRFLDGRVGGGVAAVFERSIQQPQLVGLSALFTTRDGKIMSRIHAVLI